MNRSRLVPPARLVLILCSLVGLLAGTTTAALAGAMLAERGADGAGPALEAIHLPPLLTTAGEDVQLAYEAFCVGAEAEAAADESCKVEGTVFIRPRGEGPFTPLPLATSAAPEGKRLLTEVPEAVAASSDGFEYYAELTAAGASLTVPAGGAAAPHSSLRLTRPVEVDLGAHVFGMTRSADARVAAAAWGSGSADVGLEDGRNLSPIGASAFDVDRRGTVYLLDEAGRRVLRWDRGAGDPKRIPVSVFGSLADMVVEPDGSLYVLETVGRPGRAPIVRRFDGDGRELERTEVAERTVSQIRRGREGPVVLQQPSHQWMPLIVDGSAASPKAQRENGRVGRPLATGAEVIVLRYEREIRVTATTRGGVRQSWRLRSDTPLGEVQLAELIGSHLVVVARAYTEKSAEFVVLILDARGLAQRFSVRAPEWAEAAPLGRFKLVGSSLYRLGSTPSGAFVDRFDLEVR
jgi:hypothetical protein